jgi:hypothetical protein
MRPLIAPGLGVVCHLSATPLAAAVLARKDNLPTLAPRQLLLPVLTPLHLGAPFWLGLCVLEHVI